MSPISFTGDVQGRQAIASRRSRRNIRADDVEVIEAAGNIVLPGLIDAHHHAWLGVMRRLMPDVDDLFAYIDVVAEKLGAHYRPIDMYVSTKLTAVASLEAGITTIIDACHSSRSPEHTDAALESWIRPVSGLCTWLVRRWTRKHRLNICRAISNAWHRTGTPLTAWSVSVCSANSKLTGGRSPAAWTCKS